MPDFLLSLILLNHQNTLGKKLTAVSSKVLTTDVFIETLSSREFV